MRKKIRIGIIGTGFARTVQIPAFRMCEGAEIVSVASAKLTNAKSCAEEFSIPHFTDNWRETIAREDVDLVCITSPPKFHREQALFGFRSGKHILCEKPMAMNSAEALEMLRVSKEKNVLSLIDHELRFLTGRKRAFEIIRSGEIGKIRHAKYNFRAPHRGDVNLPWTWWSDEKEGGGALGAIVSHVFDTLRWFSGSEISSVFCQLQTHVKKRRDPTTDQMRDVTSDDESNLLIRLSDSEFTEDATANISVSMVEYPIYQNRVELFGTNGALRIEYDGELFIGKADDKGWSKIELASDEGVEGARPTGWNNGFLSFAKEIIKALRDGKTTVENAATFEDGYKIQLALDAARESNEKGYLVTCS